jgi:uracil-DNA glycosylase
MNSRDADWLKTFWPHHSDWNDALQAHLQSPSFASLSSFLAQQFRHQTVYPQPENIFYAFERTSLAETKVVILGQDPYHGPGQANGLSFSINGSAKLPPTLRNIYKELATDLDGQPAADGDLTHWADQGVLLLNAVLTVQAATPHSHKQRGWETFTDGVIQTINDCRQPVVFILWGKPAQAKAAMIDDRHLKIMSPHPSPLSAYRGFFGSRPFSTANRALVEFGRSEVQWIA